MKSALPQYFTQKLRWIVANYMYVVIEKESLV